MPTVLDDLRADIIAGIPALHDAAQALWDNADVHPDVAQEACRMADAVRGATDISDNTLRRLGELCSLMEAQNGLDAATARAIGSLSFLVALSARHVAESAMAAA